ncbi:MAG: HAD-IA family hydrolase, partial [Chitinophagales bacterium]
MVQKAILDKVIELIKIDGNKRALEGIDYIFNFFKSKNIPIALASSSPSKIITATLEAIGIEDKFVVKHSAEQEVLGKPNPAVFITTANLMNVKPENCLVFEDSVNGTLAAKAAKMKCVSIPAKHDYNRPQFGIADLKLKSLLEFTETELTKISI